MLPSSTALCEGGIVASMNLPAGSPDVTVLGHGIGRERTQGMTAIFCMRLEALEQQVSRQKNPAGPTESHTFQDIPDQIKHTGL